MSALTWLRATALGAAAMLVPAAMAGAQQDPNGRQQAAAHDTAAGPIAEPATAPPPPAQEPGGKRSIIDSAKQWAKRTQILERISGDVDGWYPRLGGMTRGSGFALGPGYRTHLLDSPVLLDVSAAISYRAYKAADVRIRWLQALDKRVELWTDYRFEDFPQEDFYGLGLASLVSTRTSYTYRSSDFSIRGQIKPVPWMKNGVRFGYLNPRIRGGDDERYPSIEELFSDTTAPGLTSQPAFLHTEVFTDIDYRDAPANPKNGGFYHVAYSRWNDMAADDFDFRRFDGNVSQFVPLTADHKHIVSGRVGVSVTNNTEGGRVPFYFYPYVGGQDTIRSFRDFRFKDENAMWFGAEYRWIPIKWVSGSVFADFGKVAHNWEDLDTSRLKRGYGFGFRVHSEKQTFFRIEFGYGGGEGQRIFIKLGPSF